MKEIIDKINRTFENKLRLGIMSALMVNESIDFNSLKQYLGATDGNLSSNISVLEELGYITVNKKFIGKKVNTSYTITALGKEKFEEHLKTLEMLIKGLL